ACVQLDGIRILGDRTALKQSWRIAEIKLLRLPRQETFLDLFRETIGIRGSAECFAGQHARGFVVAVSIARRAAETAGQDVRAIGPDHAHYVGEGYVMAVPLVERLFGGLREPEIHDAAEPLLHTVILVRLQELERAQDAKFVGSLGAKLVLAAFAT